MIVNNSLISVIVPIYNIERYLPQCIESIINQTYTKLEIILVDDGSTDSSGNICDKYKNIDNRIVVIHKSNGGLVSARKAGLEIASGKYVGYVDGDDWIETTLYENLFHDAEMTNADMVCAGFSKDVEGKITKHINSIPTGFYNKEKIRSDIIPYMIFDDQKYCPGIFTYVWNKLFRREFLIDYQSRIWNDITLGEDAACIYPAIIVSKSIYINCNCSYHYCQRFDSMLKSSDNYKKDIHVISRFYEYLFKCFQLSEFSDALISQMEKYVLYLLASRTGGIIVENNNLEMFLYKNKNLNGNIAIYGAGTFGQHLYKGLSKYKNVNIVYWGDPDYTEYQLHGLQVMSPEEIIKSDFDNLIIAIFDKNEIDMMVNKFIKSGIEQEKIIYHNFDEINSHEMVNKLFAIGREY